MKEKSDNGKPLTFSMSMEDEVARRFEAIKQHYGLENNTEVIRMMIFELYKQLFPKGD